MEFTFEGYQRLIKELRNNGYTICGYDDYRSCERPVILRHDVDMSLEKAAEFAAMEGRLGVSSVYFILLTSDFYNAFSTGSEKQIKSIQALGHTIGLHFDEKRYEGESMQQLEGRICREGRLLEEITGERVNTVSMHRPSKQFLTKNPPLFGDRLINSYSEEFFHEFKYLSDSRCEWKEDVLEIVKSRRYNRLHILTHPVWYGEKQNTLRTKLDCFIKSAPAERWESLNENFTRLSDIISKPALNSYKPGKEN